MNPEQAKPEDFPLEKLCMGLSIVLEIAETKQTIELLVKLANSSSRNYALVKDIRSTIECGLKHIKQMETLL